MKKIIVKLLAIVMLLTSGCAFTDGLFFGSENKYTVQRGDTLYAISKQHNVPLRDMIELNRLSPPYNLKVGQTLRVPKNRYHNVQKGDTLYSISKSYNVNLTTLSKVNKLSPPYTLAVGDRLVLPASVSAASATASATSKPTKVGNNVKVSPAPRKTNTKTATQNKKTTPTSKATASSAKSTTTKTASTQKRSGKFDWPVKGTIISNFGVTGKGQKNDGINIKAPAGANVNAADKGTIVYAGNELKGFGNLILIKHSDGWITAYAHNEKLFVRKGQSVRRGEKIASVGKTGSVTSPQLHFEIHVNKKPVNPMNHLN